MSDYPCCECCLTDPLHPDRHEVSCPTCNNPTADRLRAERAALAAKLAHMTEACDNARAEVERLTAKLDAIEADDDKLSIMFGWLVYDVGEHTCGGYGPESGYAHEPGCGFEPVLRLDKLEGWPGEKPLDGEVDRG